MKNSLVLSVALLFISLTLQQCNEEYETPLAEKVQFTFTPATPENGGGRTVSDLRPTTLLLSLTNSANNPVVTRKEINLLRVGDLFITDPLELAPGFYKITDFLLAHDNIILYATPKTGSPLAKAVKHPLPFAFWVSKGRITNVDMEVVDVTLSTPEDFGYASFNIPTVNPLYLSVFASSDHLTLTGADAYILREQDTIKHFVLQPKVNLVSFSGDPQAIHTLIIKKEGYNIFEKDFVFNDLLASLDGQPWKIILTPSIFTMVAYVDPGTYNFFQISLGGSGTVTVDWGDGLTDTYVVDYYVSDISHTYSVPGNHPVKITGDLNKITYFYSFYGQGMIDAINIQGLTELKEIRFGLTRGPRVIDLTYNTKLEWVMIVGINEVTELVIPEENNIRTLLISGLKQLSTQDVDDIIKRIYNSVAASNRIDGRFDLSYHFFNEEESDQMVGPPSESFDKLIELKELYFWTITPEPY